MESRKITVVQTKNQKKTVVMTTATTLGELKEALREVGVDYEGMTFYEGLSKTELKKDDSILPHDIERNGVVTNELVFMLTNADKKIKSGTMSRPELYSFIKENSLQDAVKKAYGKNFTMCKTNELQEIVNKHMKASKADTVVKDAPTLKISEPEVEVKTEATVTEAPQDISRVKSAVKVLLEVLYENEYIDLAVKDEILDILESDVQPSVKEEVEEEDDMSSPYSDAEIAEMMRNM